MPLLSPPLAQLAGPGTATSTCTQCQACLCTSEWATGQRQTICSACDTALQAWRRLSAAASRALALPLLPPTSSAPTSHFTSTSPLFITITPAPQYPHAHSAAARRGGGGVGGQHALLTTPCDALLLNPMPHCSPLSKCACRLIDCHALTLSSACCPPAARLGGMLPYRGQWHAARPGASCTVTLSIYTILHHE